MSSSEGKRHVKPKEKTGMWFLKAKLYFPLKTTSVLQHIIYKIMFFFKDCVYTL